MCGELLAQCVLFCFCFPGIAENQHFKTLLLKKHYVFSTVIVVLNITVPNILDWLSRKFHLSF